MKESLLVDGGLFGGIGQIKWKIDSCLICGPEIFKICTEQLHPVLTILCGCNGQSRMNNFLHTIPVIIAVCLKVSEKYSGFQFKQE